MKVGVLAVQGDYAAHARMLGRIGVEAVEVRRAGEFGGVDGLIIPGGESTTMLKFIEEERLGGAIQSFAAAQKPILATCAGAILVAREVSNPPQPSLGLIDIDVARNAYGRQVDSFIRAVDTELGGGPLEAVFIRAPKITRVGARVATIATLEGEPVMVRQGNVIAATFHPELTDDERAHRLLIELAEGAQRQD
ncbi:MAG TPA: pyridoxal 5'-phosphate synthase glutaminase subunit PdxT [Blastocatellia bacterium]|nr:pyridoxal 5'-phosphate synthase glutaminase subunit PdxT [Blastocatellia bacterium]